MSITAPDAVLNGYQLRLPTFEGPLDVLLRLIERHQLAITDVSLVAVTDQFLAHLAAMEEAPPTTMAEFATIGARLVLIKSRSLLPRPLTVEDEGDSGDLVRQLVEYRAVQEAARLLGVRDMRAEGAFARGEGGVAVPAASAPPRLALHQPSALARALRRRLTIVPGPSAVVAASPLVSLREMIERVLVGLAGRSQLRFRAVLARCEGRDEALTAFLAVLVLIRRRVIEADQPALFGEITLRRTVREDASTGIKGDEPVLGQTADG